MARPVLTSVRLPLHRRHRGRGARAAVHRARRAGDAPPDANEHRSRRARDRARRPAGDRLRHAPLRTRGGFMTSPMIERGAHDVVELDEEVVLDATELTERTKFDALV